MRIDTVFDMAVYLEVVEKVANGFFSEDGDYQPHIGRINQFAIFADYCIKDIDEYVSDDAVLGLEQRKEALEESHAVTELDVCLLACLRQKTVGEIVVFVNQDEEFLV